MRKGEILGMKWSQVDFSRSYIKVERTKSGKTRFIPMNSIVESTLKDVADKKDHDQYVFWNSKTHKPIQDVKVGFKNACKRVGIKGLRFHDLRHNFANKLVENGVDIVTVSELLGHSDINLTVKRYSHPSPSHKKQAVESLIDNKEKKSAELLPEILPEAVREIVN
jgi:site-specific recombinase XerD